MMLPLDHLRLYRFSLDVSDSDRYRMSLLIEHQHRIPG